jgi:hypothetical protein
MKGKLMGEVTPCFSGMGRVERALFYWNVLTRTACLLDPAFASTTGKGLLLS